MKIRNENDKIATNLTFIGAFELWLFTSINMLSSAKWSSKQNSVYLGPELIRMKQVQSGLDCLREAQLFKSKIKRKLIQNNKLIISNKTCLSSHCGTAIKKDKSRVCIAFFNV